MAQLQITVLEGRNLKKKDTISENDPFVEIYLNEKYLKQKTQTKRNCKNPHWNEVLVLYVEFIRNIGKEYFLFRNHLNGQDLLHVDVYDEDSVKDERIGSVRIDLHELYEKGSIDSKRRFIRMIFIGHIDEWFELTGKSNLHSHGQIHLILDYQPLKV